MKDTSIVKDTCNALDITERDFTNILRAANELSPLLKSLKIVTFELQHYNTDTSLYKSLVTAKKEVEDAINLQNSQMVTNLRSRE